MPVSHRHPNLDWRRETPRFRTAVLRQLDRLGFRDVERRIRFEKIVTPNEWENGYAVHRGATFSHCGVGAFSLVKASGQWKIVSLIWSNRTFWEMGAPNFGTDFDRPLGDYLRAHYRFVRPLAPPPMGEWDAGIYERRPDSELPDKIAANH